jgi:hypothetical protein
MFLKILVARKLSFSLEHAIGECISLLSKIQNEFEKNV